jgi:hypothetical protein
MLPVTLASACTILACAQPPPKLAPNAELLDTREASVPLQGTEYKVLFHDHRPRDNVVVTAIQQRPLTRGELRAVARHLAGTAKRPAVDFMTSEAAASACVRAAFGAVRGQQDAADSRECSDGTLFNTYYSEPRVLYWGSAAPRR